VSAPDHCGVLVEDLDAALPAFEAFLGIAFRAAASGEPVRSALSLGGHPYVELIEARDGGPFDRAGGLGVRDVGDRPRPEGEAPPAAGEERPGALGARGETYHVAYLVEDLEEAMDRYEPLLGVEFRPPMLRPMIEGAGPDLAEPSGERIEVEFTYSLGARQPYVELMQMRDSGPIFGRENGAGFHHIGIWSPDPDAAQAAQRAAGAEIEARFFSEDGVERVCFASLGGVRGEFVNEAIRPGTEEWLGKGGRRR
jgi:catechol 2,3-dioxygenase-like lactoylglutathione lyase family enzyme